jgi:hypothetical protein
MDRLTHFKAKLKAAQAEETIRVREYNQAQRALDRVIKQVIELQKKVEDYEKSERAKLAQAERYS